MNKLYKTLIDLVLCNSIIQRIGGKEFMEDLIISIVVVLINFFLLPLLKKAIEKIPFLNDKEKETLKEETEKIVDNVSNELDKKDEK